MRPRLPARIADHRLPSRLRTRYAAGGAALAALVVIGLAAVVITTSRGDDDGSAAAGPSGSASGTALRRAGHVGWVASTHPVDTTGPIWARGGVVHLGDGTTIDTGTALVRYVVAGDGVYFIKATADVAAGKPAEVFLATPKQVGGTGELVDPESLRASSDGRYVAFVAHAAKDAPGASGEAVVIDLTTADRAVDDQGSDGILGFDDGDVVVTKPGGVDAFRLPDGRRAPGRTTAAEDASGNRNHTWRIVPAHGRDRLRSRSGRTVVPRTGSRAWELDHWLDDTTVVGFGYDRAPTRKGGIDPGSRATLLTCTVPSGDCHRIAATTGGYGSVALPAPPLG